MRKMETRKTYNHDQKETGGNSETNDEETGKNVRVKNLPGVFGSDG